VPDSTHSAYLGSWLDDSAIQPVVISLPVAILEILAENTTKMLLSERDHSGSGLALERAMESLQVGVAVALRLKILE